MYRCKSQVFISIFIIFVLLAINENLYIKISTPSDPYYLILGDTVGSPAAGLSSLGPSLSTAIEGLVGRSPGGNSDGGGAFSLARWQHTGSGSGGAVFGDCPAGRRHKARSLASTKGAHPPFGGDAPGGWRCSSTFKPVPGILTFTAYRAKYRPCRRQPRRAAGLLYVRGINCTVIWFCGLPTGCTVPQTTTVQ
jgi:hypothetical protein